MVGGAISDIWQSPVSRGIGVDLFTGAAFLGPLLGPVCGNFITSSSLGWRWNLWVLLIVALSLTAITYFILPETYAPLLARQKLRRLQKSSDWTEEKEPQKAANPELALAAYLLRPWSKSSLTVFFRI